MYECYESRTFRRQPKDKFSVITLMEDIRVPLKGDGNREKRILFPDSSRDGKSPRVDTDKWRTWTVGRGLKCRCNPT